MSMGSTISKSAALETHIEIKDKIYDKNAPTVAIKHNWFNFVTVMGVFLYLISSN
jgi:hypothetical protein